MRPRPPLRPLALSLVSGVGLLGAVGCTVDLHLILDGGDEFGDPLGDPGEGLGDGDGSGNTDGGTDEGPLPDLPEDPTPTQSALCMVPTGELEGLLPCELPAPGDTIAPTSAWTWTGPSGEDSVLTTPLVANLDDDNGDGFVDLCDTPELIVAAVDLPPGKAEIWPEGHLHVIDGADGSSFAIPTQIDAAVNPALGDLDGDGVAEIIAMQASGPNSPYTITDRRLIALSAAGELLWTGEHWQASRGGGALAVADLDNDGSPEILAPEYVATAEGALAWTVPDPPLTNSMPVAVDLDLDGQLEVLFGASAYAADGTWLFDVPTVPQNRGSVAVANFDADPYPELYVQYDGQHGVVEHDGSVKTLCSTGDLDVTGVGAYPVAIHDLDGDEQAELLFGFEDTFYVLSVADGECSLRWKKKVDASVGLATGTLFDLLGDGSSETIYADRSRVSIFSSEGELLFIADRSARESISNPLVADIDGDGAAEIVITSSEPIDDGSDTAPRSPTLLVLENADDRFASTRRVWNQHTYHHSNVAEDGRVPTYEAPHWLGDNGYRVNTRAFAGDLCIPSALRSIGQ